MFPHLGLWPQPGLLAEGEDLSWIAEHQRFPARDRVRLLGDDSWGIERPQSLAQSQ